MRSQNPFLDKVFKKQADIVYRKIAGEVILVPIRGNLADMQRIFALNRVAEYIWQKIDGQKALSVIGHELAGAFEVSKDVASADLVKFVQQLSEAKLIAEKD